jgi:hypothetical protein
MQFHYFRMGYMIDRWREYFYRKLLVVDPMYNHSEEYNEVSPKGLEETILL